MSRRVSMLLRRNSRVALGKNIMTTVEPLADTWVCFCTQENAGNCPCYIKCDKKDRPIIRPPVHLPVAAIALQLLLKKAIPLFLRHGVGVGVVLLRRRGGPRWCLQCASPPTVLPRTRQMRNLCDAPSAHSNGRGCAVT